MLGAEALKEVKTPDVTLPDPLFGDTQPGQDEMNNGTLNRKFPGETLKSAVDIY